jgi:hypothetical protein
VRSWNGCDQPRGGSPLSNSPHSILVGRESGTRPPARGRSGRTSHPPPVPLPRAGGGGYLWGRFTPDCGHCVALSGATLVRPRWGRENVALPRDPSSPRLRRDRSAFVLRFRLGCTSTLSLLLRLVPLSACAARDTAALRRMVPPLPALSPAGAGARVEQRPTQPLQPPEVADSQALGGGRAILGRRNGLDGICPTPCARLRV